MLEDGVVDCRRYHYGHLRWKGGEEFFNLCPWSQKEQEHERTFNPRLPIPEDLEVLPGMGDTPSPEVRKP
jgi:hypothetical protein